MPIKPIHVIIADDHPIVLDGLATVIAESPYCHLAGTARSFQQIIDLLATTHADVLVLDLMGMGGPPTPLIKHVRKQHPGVEIVAFSSRVDYAPELLRNGIRGYVVKEDMGSEIVGAVRAAHARQTFLSPIVETYLAKARAVRRTVRLAPQQLNAIRLLSMGYETRKIAAELGIKDDTVNNYLSKAMNDTGCENRIQLANWYRRMYGTGQES